MTTRDRMNIALQDLARLLDGELVSGDAALSITGFNSIQEAEPGDITFLGNPRYAPALKKSRASAVLVSHDYSEPLPNMGVIRVANPTLQFSLVIERYRPPERAFQFGVHPSAMVSSSVQFDASRVYIGPYVVVEDDVTIGNGTMIHAGSFIGHGCKLGENCLIHPHVVVRDRCLLGNRVILQSGAVIGGDGFGYEFNNGRHEKIVQVGIVQLDDDVEIGSCSTIDRARFGRTWIGEGTKIDNLVQIAHNVVVGKHCIIVSQVGISGSTQLGNYVTMAGQVGVSGHLHIGDKVTVLAKSGITKDLTEPGPYTGYPAKPLMEGRRALTYPAKVPEILDRLKAMEARMRELEAERQSPG